jgi:Ion channel
VTGWLGGLALSAGGVLLIGLVLWDIFQSVVLPRPSPTRVRIARNLIRASWPVWSWRAQRRSTSIDHEKILGSYAPAIVLLLLVTWMFVMVIGFSFVLFALRDGISPIPDFGSALYFAGTSVLTIGFGDITATHGLARGVSVIAGGLGLGIVALGITYLFSLYGSFQRREILVVRLEARAGAPPSGIALLETYGDVTMRPGLAPFFVEWEAWAAEVLDTHVAYPILPYFRSSHDDVSWVSALGAVLDAAALTLTTIEGGPLGEARMAHRVGSHFVEDLANFFGWPSTPLALVERSEFNVARERLAASGWSLTDADQAWEAFVSLRAGYAFRLNQMALYWVTPPAEWIGDRGAVRHSPTSVTNVEPIR